MQTNAGPSRAHAAPSQAREAVRTASVPLRGALALSLALAFAPAQAKVWFYSLPVNFQNVADCAGQSCNGQTGIYGNDSIVTSGAGTLLLIDNYSYTGGTTVSGSTLQIGTSVIAKGSLIGDVALNGTTSKALFARSDSYTIAANFSGTGKLVKSGGGTLTLTGTNSYTGTTDINDGAVNFSSASNQVLTGAITGSGDLIKSGTGTLTVGDMSSFTGKTSIDEGTLALSFAQAQTIQGNIAGNGNLALIGAGPVTLTGNLSYTGTTQISTGASLKIDSAQDQKLLGAVGSGGGLVKAGTGTLTLAGANTYTGTTIIQAGTLAFTSQADQTLAGIVIGSGNLTKSGNGTLTLKGPIGLTGLVTLQQGTLAFDSASDRTLAGGLAGSGTLMKAGTGSLVLSGDNSAFRGVTNVSAGTLQLASTQALYGGQPSAWTASRIVVQTGATATFSVGAGATDFKASDIDLLKSLGSATGGFQNGSFLGLDTTHATLGFEYAGAITDTNAGANVLGLKVLGPNTLILTGNNTYSGGTQMGGGTLQIGNGGTTGAILGNVLNNGTLVFNRSDDVGFAGLINGAGSLVKAGTNTLTLTGPDQYGGTTTINGGTLAFAANADQTLFGTVTGNGGLTKAGTGTLLLGTDSTYWGKTTVQAGTLQLNGGLDGTTGVSIAAGARLATGSDPIQIKLRADKDPTVPVGQVTVDGVLAPGGDAGGSLVLNLPTDSKLSWGQGSHLEFDLGTAQDRISFAQAGHWLAGSGLATLDLDVNNAGFDYANTYTLIHGSLADGFTFANITGYDNVHYQAKVFQTGQDLLISFTAAPVPEPQTCALLLAGLGAVGGWSRRRMRDRAQA